MSFFAIQNPLAKQPVAAFDPTASAQSANAAKVPASHRSTNVSLPYRRSGKPMKYPPYGLVVDVDGVLWNVRDSRPTKHGFDLLFGSPATTRLASGVTGLPRLIATRELIAYWEQHRLSREGVIFDLPAGRTTLKRVRYRLGFNLLRDERKFWNSLKGDLASLDANEFAKKHSVSPHVMRERRLKIVGRTARPLGWWRTPETIAILLSNATLKQRAKKLGIGITHVKRLRDQAVFLLQRQTQPHTPLDLAA